MKVVMDCSRSWDIRCRYWMGSAITVRELARVADRRGRVVGNGRGDFNCCLARSCCSSWSKRSSSMCTDARPPPLEPYNRQQRGCIQHNMYVITLKQRTDGKHGTAYNPKTDNRWETYSTAYDSKTDGKHTVQHITLKQTTDGQPTKYAVCVHVYNKHTCKNRTDAVWAMRQGGTKAIWVVCFESLNKTFLVVCKCGSMLQTCSVAVCHIQYRAHSP